MFYIHLHILTIHTETHSNLCIYRSRLKHTRSYISPKHTHIYLGNIMEISSMTSRRISTGSDVLHISFYTNGLEYTRDDNRQIKTT